MDFCVDSFIFALLLYRLYLQTSRGYLFVRLLILRGCSGVSRGFLGYWGGLAFFSNMGRASLGFWHLVFVVPVWFFGCQLVGIRPILVCCVSVSTLIVGI